MILAAKKRLIKPRPKNLIKPKTPHIVGSVVTGGPCPCCGGRHGDDDCNNSPSCLTGSKLQLVVSGFTDDPNLHEDCCSIIPFGTQRTISSHVLLSRINGSYLLPWDSGLFFQWLNPAATCDGYTTTGTQLGFSEQDYTPCGIGTIHTKGYYFIGSVRATLQCFDNQFHIISATVRIGSCTWDFETSSWQGAASFGDLPSCGSGSISITGGRSCSSEGMTMTDPRDQITAIVTSGSFCDHIGCVNGSQIYTYSGNVLYP